MTYALDQSARSALERFVQRARRLLEDDLARHAEGRFGIQATDGTIEDEDGLHLSPDDLVARRDIVDVLQFIRREERDHAAAAARLIREAAFTHLNRLVAIRIAEAIGLLPESIANGPASGGYRELLEVAPLLAHNASRGYWRYLQLCGDELAADLPQLFDPRNPLLELTPSPAAFDELIELLTAAELGPVWDAPDGLGWVYQFFNSGDERRAMRDASASPRNSRELAVRNQFFTPRYVVDFLVHNSLGRRLLDADPSSPLIDDLPLLLDPPTEPGEPLALADVRVLDPACGSGHFLLGAYDVLERAWHHAGVEPEAAAAHIIGSLWGIDIDPRCSQVAAAAIILRARRVCHHLDLPIPNIICARALPEPTEGWDTLLAGLPPDRSQLVAAMRDALNQAPVLGPLLKVEERLATEIRAHVAGADVADGTLFAATGIAGDTFGKAEADVLDVLRQIADQTRSTPAERLFASEANDAIRFVEALRHRYDVVLMNPPFGEPADGTKSYLRAAYPWLPKIGDLFAAFVGRGLELTKPSAGSFGAITSRAGFFLSSFEPWRREVILKSTVQAVADLGNRVMEEAMVEAAAYVLRPHYDPTEQTTFVRLLKDRDKEAALRECVRANRASDTDPRRFSVVASEFSEIPGTPIAYWMGDSVRKLFQSLPSVQQEVDGVFKGTSTSDDFRFVRTRWEVDPLRLGYTVTELGAGSRWAPFAKGGEYSPYWLDLRLVINWEGAGREIKDTVAEKYPYLNGNVDWVIGREEEFFKPGITWSARTMSGFSPRLFPAGAVFGHKGNKLAARDIYSVLGWLNSRVVAALIGGLLAAADETASGGASKSYEIGVIRSLPFAPLDRSGVASKAEEIARLFAGLDRFDETSSRFDEATLVEDELATENASAIEILKLSSALEDYFITLLDLDSSSKAFIRDEVGIHPYRYPTSFAADDDIARLYQTPLRELIDELLKRSGGSKAIANLTFVANRRLEVISHGLGVSPEQILQVVSERALREPGDAERSARRVVSYLVGVAFGRWRGRPKTGNRAGDGERDLLAAPARYSESMWVPGIDQKFDGERDEVINRPEAGILLFEKGHAASLPARIVDAARWSLGSEEMLDAAMVVLDSQLAIQRYLQSQFFKDHLSRYSLSRRKAPIYLPLTTASGKWGVWVYAPCLTRETLYVVASEALRREAHAELEMERLERERAAGGGGRGAKALDKALDDERKLAEELRRFRQEAERIAGLGWEPDLDDGIVLCAAPLADLFPQWRKDLAGVRDELRTGKHRWSTVSKWADQL
jgi:hypothetical protein